MSEVDEARKWAAGKQKKPLEGTYRNAPYVVIRRHCPRCRARVERVGEASAICHACRIVFVGSGGQEDPDPASARDL